MSLSDNARHQAINISADKFLSSIPKNLLDFLIGMNNGADLTRTGWYYYNGTSRILSENNLLAVLILRSLFTQLADIDNLGFHKILQSIIFTMDDLQKEVSISEEEPDFIWINFLELYSYFLNYLIVLRNLSTSILKDFSINLLLQELFPKALRWISCEIFIKYVLWEPPIIFKIEMLTFHSWRRWQHRAHQF